MVSLCLLGTVAFHQFVCGFHVGATLVAKAHVAANAAPTTDTLEKFDAQY